MLANGTVTLQDVQLTPTVISVELVDIKVKKSGEVVVLEWETASETQTKSFHIERSTKELPLDFVKIGEERAQGKGSRYVFYDEKPISQMHYYRLKINPENVFDTKKEYSRVVSIFFDDKKIMKVTPSVSKGILTIENGESVDVFNPFGQQVFRQKLSNSIQYIDLSFLNKGQYIVIIHNGNIVSIHKIYIEN